jgi:hypothetical protein
LVPRRGSSGGKTFAFPKFGLIGTQSKHAADGRRIFHRLQGPPSEWIRGLVRFPAGTYLDWNEYI